MMPRPSILRQVYDAAALVAVLNVLGLFALGGLLMWSGAINGEKLRRIVGVLRGEEPPPVEEQVVEAQEEEASDQTPVEAVAQSQMDLDIMRLEGERIKQELDQRLALNSSILLRVMTEREKFEQQRKENEAKQQDALARRRAEGFRKQIGIYEALSPKVALKHLLDMSDPDEAARVLLEMTTRKAKKIVETAKSGDQLQKMKVILRRVRDVAPDRSAELEATGP